MEDTTQEVEPVQTVAHQGPWLVEVGNVMGIVKCVLRSGERVVLGSGKGADLRVSDPTVSGRHCEISAGRDGLELRDLGSKNGVFVGAARVERAWLRAQPASVVMGCSTIVVRRGDEDLLCDAEPLPGLIGTSSVMRGIAMEVRRHARLKAPILIQGESGTGKDVVARAIHILSGRTGPYLPLNVGAIQDSIADAELFGHRRGAFTGAVSSRQGAFEHAHRGTLFLDEVAELAPAVQVKLLRVVEDGLVRAVGSVATSQVDVRLVSATWARLPERVALGRFRADLYHRLSTVVIALPPLRARKVDIPVLCDALLARLEVELGRKQLSSGALARIAAYDWPGNVRELGSVLYRAAVSAPGSVIGPEHVALMAGAIPAKCCLGPADAQALLAKYEGNISAASRAARVPRTTFRAWLRRSG